MKLTDVFTAGTFAAQASHHSHLLHPLTSDVYNCKWQSKFQTCAFAGGLLQARLLCWKCVLTAIMACQEPLTFPFHPGIQAALGAWDYSLCRM